jgi:hypothetical protein
MLYNPATDPSPVRHYCRLDKRTELALAEAIAALCLANHGIRVPICRIRKYLATLDWERPAVPLNPDGSP